MLEQLANYRSESKSLVTIIIPKKSKLVDIKKCIFDLKPSIDKIKNNKKKNLANKVWFEILNFISDYKKTNIVIFAGIVDKKFILEYKKLNKKNAKYCYLYDNRFRLEAAGIYYSSIPRHLLVTKKCIYTIPIDYKKEWILLGNDENIVKGCNNVIRIIAMENDKEMIYKYIENEETNELQEFMDLINKADHKAIYGVKNVQKALVNCMLKKIWIGGDEIIDVSGTGATVSNINPNHDILKNFGNKIGVKWY